MKKKPFLIGIDLGTTNCTLAYSPDRKSIKLLSIEQMTLAGEKELYSLPSFLYFSLPEEVSSGLPTECIGAFARDRGAELPDRTIASAKSWLCQPTIDRRAPILPSKESSFSISPLQCCAKLLAKLKDDWNKKHPNTALDKQQLFITVPASFDPSARQLVQEAALEAGYPEVILLEEPQAAFYAWLYRHKEDWRQLLKVGDTILVIDIGGGTTDFSLIQVENEQGDLALRRLAVGAHLLLGGDNLDMALAHLVSAKFEEQGVALDRWQMQTLVHQCREAKEIFLDSNPPEKMDISIRGKSSRLVGGTLTATLTLIEVQQLLIDGFFPLIEPEESSQNERRLGIQSLGLNYAQDPRVSCQLAKFLSMTGEDESRSMEKFILPSAVLFNGGSLKSKAIRDRLAQLLNQWAERLKKPLPTLLDSDYDFAVSFGAVNYGLACEGESIRIRGGASRSYYIGVEDSLPAIPGLSTPLKAICVVPFGMEEGSERVLDEQFSLLLGELVTFRFFSRSTPDVLLETRNYKKELTELHPIETVLDRGESEERSVVVTLHAKVTELGTLELWFHAEGDRKWRLEFDLRNSQ